MREQTGEAPAVVLPAGTVTFLLTDIEGSTALWERAAESMPAAVARHYEIIGSAAARHGGVRPVEQGEGDSLVVAFARAGDAVGAALDAQRALLAEAWPDGAELRVRMALHTGDARLRDEGNYFGTSVNRCARLRSIARGGEVLVSRSTHDLAEDALPAGAELVDLGVHRLRDLGRPEHVFGLAHPDLPPIVEPLRSLDALPNNLPVEPSSFVGRDSELANIAEALRSTRALTLTGAGGCGKTRLALHAAADALERYPDGVWWVELAPLADPDLLDDAVASAVGVRALPGQRAREALIAHLGKRRALVVLDNCEHILGPSAELADALLRGCPDVSVLVTSREPLGLPGEASWLVPSLSLPDGPEAEATALATQSDAVRLFIERASQVRPNFAVTNDTAPALAQICHDLDGIPLAIELAAARVRMLSLEQIAAGLADRFRLLTGGARTALPRQQTLRASVEWSHDLLTEPERVLLRRLGVFGGGFDLDLCEEVCAGEELDRYAILDLLTSLVDKSLVLVEERGALTRYRLLETVRHYALDRLVEAGETESLRNRHRDAFLALAERIEPDLLSEREPEALALLDAESANLHAAIEWAADTAPDLALRLCAALTLWWRLRGLFSAGGATVARALEAAPAERSAHRARALWARGYIAISAFDLELAHESATEALAIGEELEDEWIQGRALHLLTFFELFGNPRAAVPIGERACEVAHAAGDDFAYADAKQLLGVVRWMQDDYDGAIRDLDRSLEVAERLGNRDIMATHWFVRSATPFGTADLERRRASLERSLALSGEIGDPQSEGLATGWLALLEVQTGNAAGALERAQRCHERMIVAGAGMPLATLDCYSALAEAALGRHGAARERLARVLDRGADGYAWMHGSALAVMGGLERQLGRLASARDRATAAEAVARHVGSSFLAALAEYELARCAAAEGDWGEADRLLHESLRALVEGGHEIYVPDVLEGLAEVAAGLESSQEAARLLAAVARAREEIGIVRWTGEHEHWHRLELELREGLGVAAYEAAVEEGRALSMDEAVAYVRRARGERKRPSGGWESLTPTELDVARHASVGLTNPEIGERMFISRGTVKVHLSHVYAKLGIRNRGELTAGWARRHEASDAPPSPADRG